ncbi:Chaperone protein ClpB [Posidoniimonas polymericola]|uniref:Chaperone protein ClpB n=1 Tax=Posidoniimonas polymericola TaxID=2528002 RepID=A0A5C5XX25_9BACT|nr:AAA family ATPase [Posidoniimonas polymericola]TWT66903.1 Chaperone protein ClpB [Posidoniimonas polymericola]
MTETSWQRDLNDALLLDPLVLLHGNVKDLFLADARMRSRAPRIPEECPYVPLEIWLALDLEHKGYDVVLIYDLVDGAIALRGRMASRFESLVANGATREGSSPASRAASPPANQSEEPPRPRGSTLPRSSPDTQPEEWLPVLSTRQEPIDFFGTLYNLVLPTDELAVAVICRYMDRHISFTDRQNEEEKRLSLLIQKAARTVRPRFDGDKLASKVVMLFDVEGAIPQELSVQAPFSRSIRLPVPGTDERESFFRSNHNRFYSSPGDRFSPDDDSNLLRHFANLTEGLRTQDLLSLVTLSHSEKLGLGKPQFKILLDRFRFGARENAWLKIREDTLKNSETTLKERVKGQDEVIGRVAPTLIRAKLGLSDIGKGANSTKPRGVFFFVGPTGVGKTELSKSIAELLFGDEASLIRFDMSEYSEEHQQARLIGAPPGYVGFDQGGQLTNAVLDRPFSVLLFDEIEKAHGRILDKFLQILDDGRLTDGMGRTVYFTESIIIFTSNLGTAPRHQTYGAGASVALGGIQAPAISERYEQLSSLSYDDLADHFRREVKGFFVDQLGRPEILNRIGEDNILVFNFLKDGDAQDQIVQKQVADLNTMLEEKYRISVEVTPAFRRLLRTHPSGFERNGARGVRNLLRRYVMDQLAMELFTNEEKKEGQVFQVDYREKSDSIGELPFDSSKLQWQWYELS